MLRLRTLLAPLTLAGALASTSDALAAVDEYLQLDVPATPAGSSLKVDATHSRWLTIHSFAWQDPTNVPLVRSPDPTHPNHLAMVITREQDASSAKILDLVRTHKVLDKVIVDERKTGVAATPGATTSDLYRILMTQVTITDYSVKSGSSKDAWTPRPTETFVLHFTKIEVQHFPMNGQNAGTQDKTMTDSWDVQT